MLQKYRDVFFDAAERFTCWIGLREPNPLSEKWIGLPGCVPKGENCKAKSADNPSHRFAGLVADPNTAPDAFTEANLKVAKKTWEKFAHHGKLPIGFAVIGSGPEAGLLTFNGQRIHADFDLMAINKANRAGDFLFTTYEEQVALYEQVEPVLNAGFRTKMIQHGAEFMWKGGLGARESEFVHWFGPGRRFKIGASSMPSAPGTMH
jgi:hypothetical protein